MFGLTFAKSCILLKYSTFALLCVLILSPLLQEYSLRVYPYELIIKSVKPNRRRDYGRQQYNQPWLCKHG